MRRLRRQRSVWMLAGALLACGLATGCTPEPTTLNFRFPSTESFLYSSHAQVLMFDIAHADRGACPSIHRYALEQFGDWEPSRELEQVSVCELRDGGVTFMDIGPGLRAFAAVVRDSDGQALLSGCTTSDTYPDAPEVDIWLAPTDEYGDIIAEIGELRCADEEQKCDGGGC